MENKIALISGGLGDIGQAIAIHLGKLGAKIALSDLQEEAAVQSQLEALRTAGCRELLYTRADVSVEAEVTDWLNRVEEHWGTPQVVVPNAGIVVAGSLSDMPSSELRRQMDVNFWGSYHMAVQAAQRIKNKELPGRIVFIGSWAAERPNARISSYCISKAAIRMLCKSLALELAAHHILVNEVAPGIVEGGLSKKNQQKDPALRQTHLDSIPMHTLVSVEEVADHVGMLSSFTGMNITGTTLLVDGGLSLTSKMTP
ncbi:SDR family NAD(P)-dependent oxidoreductase [Flavisolibacter tropicus]|nr:SDR family oxidoreductase [Flavisolibacter tropicus]